MYVWKPLDFVIIAFEMGELNSKMNFLPIG